MMLPLAIAEKLYLLTKGEQIPGSKLKNAIVAELIDEGLISERISGRTKTTLYISNAAAFHQYLDNKWSIASLEDYILTLRSEPTRASLVQVSNDSKTVATRTFKGFLINSCIPVQCTLNGGPLTIMPAKGSFQFIYDFEQFAIPSDVVVVGIENPENFRFIDKQQHLFPGMRTLFISRYPQHQYKDVIRWLQSIPNPYLHMGDYDFAGINIYLQEYKKHLGGRASFFIPPNIEELIERYGNKTLYDRQQLNSTGVGANELQTLIALMHRHKKCLEQEALLIG